jgi:hypothetical protein
MANFPVQGNVADDSSIVNPDLYEPVIAPLNVKETMTLSPMFTPDNAIDIHVAWIKNAQTSIDVQNPYLTQWDSSVSWAEDPSRIVRALVDAHNDGVKVRLQINEENYEDTRSDVSPYFLGLGIEVRWMGNADSNPDNDYLSDTHNKLVIIDEEVTLLSSINFGESAFTINREAGMVIQSTTVTSYYLDIFETDWINGEVAISSLNAKSSTDPISIRINADYPSHTDIPHTNFTGVYNVTAFTNPDNADEVIFKYLKSAKESIYVSMYTISRPEFNNTLIDLKKANPNLDIQVLISNRRVGDEENTDTHAAATSLVENLIPVYNSTKDDDKVDGLYHNKYWIIDGIHTFVYSGNWSPRSVTPQLEPGDTTYTSGEANRDMGIGVLDASDIADFYKSVWDDDVAVADAWELPIKINQNSFEQSDVVSGTITLSATSNVPGAIVSYAFGDSIFTEIETDVSGSFSFDFDTTTIDNGITSFKVKAVTGTQEFTDEVSVNIVNIGSDDNWRLLITEVHPDPDVVSDTKGEFFELTNSFPFALLIEGWKVGDLSDLHEFTDNYEIAAYTSIIVARNLEGFNLGFDTIADIELDFSLTNDGDLVQLINHKGEYMDVVAFGDETAPDGSESVSDPDAGLSILRTELHIDTNTASDFSIGSPDPKGTVPHITLGAAPQTTDPLPLLFEFIIGALILVPIVVQRKRK